MIIESGIILDFPDDNFFRFQDCEGYIDIQQNFKEMDACWYDQANDKLYVKDWGNGRLGEEDNPAVDSTEIEKMKEGISKHRINELHKKTLDSMSMFISVLLRKPYATKIKRCMPFQITDQTNINLITIINWTNPDPTYILTINTAYKALFKPYAKLFGINSYVVMTKNQAMNMYPSWVKNT